MKGSDIMSLLDKNGLLLILQKIKTLLSKKVDTVQGVENYGKVFTVNSEGNADLASFPSQTDVVYDETKSRLVITEKTNLPGNISVDPLLLNEGDAADAKVTGDRFNKLSEEKVNNPPTGVVGQILEIETVDENGKPKTYKAVNKPIGGGEVTDEQISNAVDNYMAANPIEESDPTVPEWAKQPEKPIYTASEVGADASGTAESKLSVHNTATDSHNDIRLLIEGLTTRLNALADSDDTTLDQMSEVVAYIKSNKSLIDAITTSKVSVSDIVNNLRSNNADRPLSAKQGTVLKSLIDAITIPEKLPNPNALSITVNGTTETYDGSEVVTIDIPSRSTDKLENFEVATVDETKSYLGLT